MRKYWVHPVALTTAVLMLFGAAACGGQPSGNNPTATVQATENAAVTQQQPDSAQPDITDVHIFYSGTDSPDSNAPGLAKIREEVGLNLLYENNPDPRDKLNILLASGDYPEVIYLNKDDIYDKYLQSGNLLALDDYLDLAPTYKKAIEKYMPLYKNASDGKLYFFAHSFDETPHLDNAFIMRFDLWEKSGSPAIKTNTDLIELARKMKEAEPEVNGQPTYPFVFFFGDTWGDEWYDKVAVAAMGQTMYGKCNLAANGERLKMVDYMVATQEFYDAMKFANLLYREGLADPQSAVNKNTDYTNTLNDGRSFFGITTWDPLSINAALANAGHPEQVIDPVFLKWEGYTGKTFYSNQWNAGASQSIVLTDKCTFPEKMMQLAEYLNTPEGMVLGYWGVKDQNYTVDEKGWMTMNPETLNIIKTDSKWSIKIGTYLNFIASPRGLTPVGQPIDYTRDPDFLSANYSDAETKYATQLGYKAFDEPFNNDYIGSENTALNGSFNLPENSPEIAIRSKADTLSNQVTAQLFLAESDAQFDEIYNKAIADLKAMGYDKFVKIYSDNLEQLQDAMGLKGN